MNYKPPSITNAPLQDVATNYYKIQLIKMPLYRSKQSPQFFRYGHNDVLHTKPNSIFYIQYILYEDIIRYI